MVGAFLGKTTLAHIYDFGRGHVTCLTHRKWPCVRSWWRLKEASCCVSPVPQPSVLGPEGQIGLTVAAPSAWVLKEKTHSTWRQNWLHNLCNLLWNKNLGPHVQNFKNVRQWQENIKSHVGFFFSLRPSGTVQAAYPWSQPAWQSSSWATSFPSCEQEISVCSCTT